MVVVWVLLIVVVAAFLAACYIVLDATTLGVAGALGIAGGAVVVLAIVIASRLPAITPLVLGAAVLPFAILNWWSVVSPLVAALSLATGLPALHRAPYRVAEVESERTFVMARTSPWRSDVGRHAEARQ